MHAALKLQCGRQKTSLEEIYNWWPYTATRVVVLLLSSLPVNTCRGYILKLNSDG